MIWGFRRRGEAPPVVVSRPREKTQETPLPQESPKQGIEDTLEGVITDQRLLQWFYKVFKGADVHPIATDQFLNKSKDQYTAPWLTRELVQNFIDHNPKAPGTLDDVQFHKHVLPDGTTRFTIQGRWKFPDPTGVLSPHSDKPTDFNTAGGNGIGLKQSAIRFLRDFGVTRFEIRGEKWQVSYHLAKRDAINHDMRLEAAKKKQSPVAEVKHDWLVGDVRQTEETGVNTYVLETKNKEMITALESFPSLGVSSSNEFLRDPDFKNKHGAIKWILPEGRKQKRGRLFINGQVMHWDSVGKKADDYWTGPQGLTLQLNNVSYKMSIDRPPVRRWDLHSYIHDLIASMSTKEIVAQLQRSESLWIREDDSRRSDEDAIHVVVGDMVSQLSARSFGVRNFASAFNKKKYLALDTQLNMWNKMTLRKQGYVFCPEYFSHIGVPLASTVLNALDAKAGAKPDAEKIMKKQSEIAESVGTRVGAPEFSIQKPEDMLTLIRRHLISRSNDMHITENAIHFLFPTTCSKELLLHDLITPRKYSDDQELLYFTRGVIKAGLTSKALQTASLTANEYKQTYATAEDKVTQQTLLFARSTKQKYKKGTEVRLEFNPSFFELLKPLLEAKSSPTDGGPSATQGPGAPLPEGVPNTALRPNVEADEFGGVAVEADSRGVQAPGPVAGASGGAVADTPGVGGGKQRRPVRVIEGPSDMLNPEVEDEEFGSAQRKGPVRPSEPAADDQLFEPERVARPVQKVAFPKEVKATQIYTGEQPEQEVIDTTSTLPPEEAARLKELKKQMPALEAALKMLDAAIPHVTSVKKPEKIIDDYIAARRSPDFKKKIVEGVGYVDGRHLTEILLEGTQAKIPDSRDTRARTPEENLRAELSDKLKQLAIRAAGDDEDDMNIDMVLNPREEHLAQLALLRQYIVLTTSPAFANDLFVFRGAKTKGINISRRAIGIHEAVFATSFEEALAVMVHELAHNEPEAMGHDYRFMHTMQTLFVFSEKAIYDIAAKRDRGDKLSNREVVILDMRNQWDRLRQTK